MSLEDCRKLTVESGWEWNYRYGLIPEDDSLTITFNERIYGVDSHSFSVKLDPKYIHHTLMMYLEIVTRPYADPSSA
jgi:hypothetical protein